jgi:hypothetical protein
MSSRARHIVRGFVSAMVLFLAVAFSGGDAQAALGPEYNAVWPHGDCWGSYIQAEDPTTVADLSPAHRITWTTRLWRFTYATGWNLAVENRDYTKNVASNVYHPAWVYRLGMYPNSVGSVYPDYYPGVDVYTIYAPGRYRVEGMVYYYAARDWRVGQLVYLNFPDGSSSAECRFGGY